MIPVRQVKEAAIVDLPEVLDNEALMGTVQSLLGEQKKTIALNMTRIGFIESSGLGSLVSAYKICENQGGSLVIYGVQSYVQKLIEITKLNRILKIAAHENEALDFLTN
jgi:anti-sigma B factor antagonist